MRESLGDEYFLMGHIRQTLEYCNDWMVDSIDCLLLPRIGSVILLPVA